MKSRHHLIVFAVGLALGCSSPADDTRPAPTTKGEIAIAASPETRTQLGVTRWTLREDGRADDVITGYDESGAPRAQVHVQKIADASGQTWVEIASASGLPVAMRFTIQDGAVVIRGADAFRDEPRARMAIQRASADLPLGPSGALTTKAIRPDTEPLLNAPTGLINDVGECLIFGGRVVGAVGSATGNGTLSACGAVLGCAGQAMSCYGNFK